MKQLFTTVVAIFFMVTTSFAYDNFFYKNASGQWNIFGHSGNHTLNPSCVMQTSWKDGSNLLVIQDLFDGELYINFLNKKWNMQGPYNKKYELTLRFIKGKNTIDFNAEFILTNNDSIVIRDIKHKAFLDSFSTSDTMIFIVHGDTPDISVGLKGSSNILDSLKECMFESQNVRLYNPKKGQAI